MRKPIFTSGTIFQQLLTLMVKVLLTSSLNLWHVICQPQWRAVLMWTFHMGTHRMPIHPCPSLGMTPLGQGLSTCLTRRTQYPSLRQDSCCSLSCIANNNHCLRQHGKHSSFYQYLSLWLWGGMMRRLMMLVSSAAWTWLSTTSYTFQNGTQLSSSCCTIHINSLFGLGPHSSPYNHPQNRAKHLENPETNTSMDLQPDSSGKINKIYLYILYFEQPNKNCCHLQMFWWCTQSLYVIDEDIKQNWFQYRPLRGITHDWFPSGHWATDPLDVTIKPIPHPPDSPAITFISPV